MFANCSNKFMLLGMDIYLYVIFYAIANFSTFFLELAFQIELLTDLRHL